MATNTVIDGIKIGPDGRAMSARDTLNQIYGTNGVGLWNTNYLMSNGQKNALNTSIKAFENRGWTVGFVMVDINSGQAITYHPTTGIYSASAIKGPYVMSLLHSGYSPNGQMYNAIKWSNNSDYEYIRRRYGSGVFADFLPVAGVSRNQASSYYTTTTCLDLSKMWLQGYQTLFGVNAQNSNWARSTFQNVSNSQISASLSRSKTVYSRAGWIAEGGYYNVLTDGAIVTNGKNPFILSIMSTAPGIGEAYQMRDLAYQLDMIHSEMVD